jgi:glycosyltransferase involved in cell wall biosynthesis
MSKCDVICCADPHAKYSAKLWDDIKKYQVIPVGADELMFKPDKVSVTLRHTRSTWVAEAETRTPRDTGDVSNQSNQKFTVLYYGSMLPLHGVKFVLKASLILKKCKNIEFYIVGGKSKLAATAKEYQDQGANIVYKKWVDYDKIPDLIKQSNLCLGGPFGDTTQSQFVITGKTYQFLASGRPVIIGKNQESEVFSNKKNILIVDQASPDQLADAILWAYDPPDELEKIAEQGRGLYEIEFSSERIARYLRNVVSAP